MTNRKKNKHSLTLPHYLLLADFVGAPSNRRSQSALSLAITSVAC
ncbi:hypothetical protein ACFOGG_18410 [Brenneria rubrifaciens]